MTWTLTLLTDAIKLYNSVSQAYLVILVSLYVYNVIFSRTVCRTPSQGLTISRSHVKCVKYFYLPGNPEDSANLKCLVTDLLIHSRSGGDNQRLLFSIKCWGYGAWKTSDIGKKLAMLTRLLNRQS